MIIPILAFSLLFFFIIIFSLMFLSLVSLDKSLGVISELKVSQLFWFNCQPFGAPADPALVAPLRNQYSVYHMRNVVVNSAKKFITRVLS